MAKNAKPKINDEAAYENAHMVAQDLLTRIAELLFDLPAPGDGVAPESSPSPQIQGVYAAVETKDT